MILINLTVLFIVGQEGEIFLNIYWLKVIQDGYRKSSKIFVMEIRIGCPQEIKKCTQVVSLSLIHISFL